MALPCRPLSRRLGWLPLEAEQKVEDLDDYAPEPEVHAYLHSRRELCLLQAWGRCLPLAS